MSGINSIWKEMKAYRLNEESMNEAYSQKLKDKALELRSKSRLKDSSDSTEKDYRREKIANDIIYDRSRKEEPKYKSRTMREPDYYDMGSQDAMSARDKKQHEKEKETNKVAKSIDRNAAKNDSKYSKDRRSIGKSKNFYDSKHPFDNAEARREKRLAKKGVKYEKGPKGWAKYNTSLDVSGYKNESLIDFAEHIRSLSEEEFADYLISLYESQINEGVKDAKQIMNNAISKLKGQDGFGEYSFDDLETSKIKRDEDGLGEIEFIIYNPNNEGDFETCRKIMSRVKELVKGTGVSVEDTDDAEVRLSVEID